MEELIRELLAYSFVENGEVIPYENLTTREKSIVTKKEYRKVIAFVKDGTDLYSTVKSKEIPNWVYILTVGISSFFGNLIYHLFIK